jgi:hypothetical protein
MNVLIGCEFSGIVREAFRQRGHEAWSCDLLPAEDDSPYHLQADLNYVLNYPDRVLGGRPRWMRDRQWDLLIAHPPCTYLCNSGVRWLYGGKGTTPNPERWRAMEAAAAFFGMLWAQRLIRIPKVCIENPIMHRHARDRIFGKTTNGTQTQTIQPWQFGHPEIKATCLWLSDTLPALTPTNIVEGRIARVHRASPSPDRWKERSRTLQGIADAMAEQWGGLRV